jgi:hypothetical protein
MIIVITVSYVRKIIKSYCDITIQHQTSVTGNLILFEFTASAIQNLQLSWHGQVQQLAES